MDNLTQPRRLQDTADYRRWVAARRNEAIARQAEEIQADIARLQDLYANGSHKRPGAKPEPAFTEATSYKVTRLPGGASLSGRKGRAPKDTSPEAEAKRARRRERRAARKARQAAST